MSWMVYVSFSKGSLSIFCICDLHCIQATTFGPNTKGTRKVGKHCITHFWVVVSVSISKRTFAWNVHAEMGFSYWFIFTQMTLLILNFSHEASFRNRGRRQLRNGVLKDMKLLSISAIVKMLLSCWVERWSCPINFTKFLKLINNSSSLHKGSVSSRFFKCGQTRSFVFEILSIRRDKSLI